MNSANAEDKNLFYVCSKTHVFPQFVIIFLGRLRSVKQGLEGGGGK